MGEKETASDEEVARMKNKTKSNQSNDRLDVDDDGDGVGLENAGEEKKKEEARMAAGGGAGGPEAAINNTKSNIKNREAGITDAPETTWPNQTERSSDQPRVAQQGFRSAVVDERGPSLAINEEGVAEGNPKPKNT